MKIKPFPVSFDSPIKDSPMKSEYPDYAKDLLNEGYFNNNSTASQQHQQMQDHSMLSPYSASAA
jgi:hypothetical protein